jgi:predicted SpoU family rRNA methylase
MWGLASLAIHRDTLFDGTAGNFKFADPKSKIVSTKRMMASY